MSFESSQQAKAKRTLAQRARRLADGGLTVPDRNSLLRLAAETDVEAEELERQTEAERPLKHN